MSDFDVQNMNMEEVGVYVYLLFADWLEGGIPDDLTVVEGWLKHRCTTVKSVAKPWEKFTLIKDGRRFNKRLNQEREKQQLWREKSSRGGKKSADARRKVKGGTRVVKPKGKGGVHSVSVSVSDSYSDSDGESKKKKKEPEQFYITISRGFLEFQRQMFPKESAWKDFDKCISAGAKNLELFNTQNDWSDSEIETLLDWIPHDSFWSRQIRTLGGIRNRKNGEAMKFENAKVSMIGSHDETLEEQGRRLRGTP